ncbi:MAG: glutamine-hydrolyzing carbamoyl-phosphate synthase small subunit [Coriobacteriia bacterium]|nr:glutamine-hydrolyzing carbamoyl-phosphate synthase small subunit [Coriobacteriia bacterium]
MTRSKALLALEDGTVFHGFSCGVAGEVDGEICFNTSMTGYQEIFSDPSYAGQIITMTSPHIGNYGVNAADMESRAVFARGFVVRALSRSPSSWRAEGSLRDFFVRHNVVAIEGVDTRRLVRHIRECGALKAVISTVDLDEESVVAKAKASPGLVGRDLVAEVAVSSAYRWGGLVPGGGVPADIGAVPIKPDYRVVALDSGIKYNIARQLSEVGCEVIVVPPTTPAETILEHKPDGIFVANGPGDPSAVDYLFETLRILLGKRPVFGICLGHQMLGLAVGASVFKLKYGHRGANQPVKNLRTGKVEITSQNHGFCLDFASVGRLDVAESGGLDMDTADLRAWVQAGVAPVVRSEGFGRVQLTHVNLNDMTCEGIRLLDVPAFSVQYHPEAAAGPHDSRSLFKEFVNLMKAGA